MPQMKPMYWVPLLIYFLTSYLLTMTLPHYNSYKIKLTMHPYLSPSPLNTPKKWNFKW